MKVGLDYIPDKVDINVLVVIDGYSVVNTDNATVLKLKLTSFTDKIIRSVKVFAKGYNDFGDIVCTEEKDSFEMLLQDMLLKDSLIYNFELPKEVSTARKFDFAVEQVCYANGEIQSSEQPEYVKTCMADKIQDEYYLRFAKTKAVDAKYYAEDHGKYWSCICGYVNTGDKCRYCIVSKQIALGFTKENIVDTCREFVDRTHEEEQKKAERQEKLENQKEKIKSVAVNAVSNIKDTISKTEKSDIVSNDENNNVSHTENKSFKSRIKNLTGKWKIILCVIVLVVVVVGSISVFKIKHLSSDERLAYNDVLTLQSMMQEPDSLSLYDKIYIQKVSDADGNETHSYVIFDFNAENGYGYQIKDSAVFKDDEFLFTFGLLDSSRNELYDKSDLSEISKQLTKLWDQQDMLQEIEKALSDDDAEKVVVDAKKIMKRIK